MAAHGDRNNGSVAVRFPLAFQTQVFYACGHMATSFGRTLTGSVPAGTRARQRHACTRSIETEGNHGKTDAHH